jgi:hypothetical protein
MARRYSNIKYWCIEFTDRETGMITEAGNESSFPAITLWAQKNLSDLPRGEGKFIRKKLRNG